MCTDRALQRGQSIVEMALMTPVLLLIVAGIVESGRAFLAYLQLANAAREGARAGSFLPTDSPVINLVARQELPDWISTDIVSVDVTCAAEGDEFDECVTTYNAKSGDQIKVEIRYNYEPLMPIGNFAASFTNLTMITSAIMRVQ